MSPTTNVIAALAIATFVASAPSFAGRTVGYSSRSSISGGSYSRSASASGTVCYQPRFYGTTATYVVVAALR